MKREREDGNSPSRPRYLEQTITLKEPKYIVKLAGKTIGQLDDVTVDAPTRLVHDFLVTAFSVKVAEALKRTDEMEKARPKGTEENSLLKGNNTTLVLELGQEYYDANAFKKVNAVAAKILQEALKEITPEKYPLRNDTISLTFSIIANKFYGKLQDDYHLAYQIKNSISEAIRKNPFAGGQVPDTPLAPAFDVSNVGGIVNANGSSRPAATMSNSTSIGGRQ